MRRKGEALASGAAVDAGTGVLSRLRRAGLGPRKALGQHFLHDPRLLGALVTEAKVTSRDSVFEVGTGPGTLTRELAQRAARVLTVDVDPKLLRFAQAELEPWTNLVFLESDALDRGQRLHPRVVEALQGWRDVVWVSNLPYNLATTLIIAFCESPIDWRRASLTVQEEVAQRLAASPGDPAYGPVTALAGFWAQVRLGRKIPPGAFWPPPRVDSRVVHLERRPPLGETTEYDAFKGWVKLLFLGRRKQVGSLLRRHLEAPDAARAIECLSLDPALRPGDLAPAAILSLARHFPLFSR